MQIIQETNTIKLFYNDAILMEDICIYSIIDGIKYEGQIKNILRQGTQCTLELFFEHRNLDAEVRFMCKNEGIVVDIYANIRKEYLMPQVYSFDPEEAFVITFKLGASRRHLARYMESRWWSHCSFLDIPDKTQELLVDYETIHCCYTPLCAGRHRAQFKIEENCIELYIGSECAGTNKISGTFLTVGCSTDPYESILQSHQMMRNCNDFITPLKKNKKIPDFVDGLGWCTWNAFYHDVTASKIISKLNEFRDKGICLNWIIIDDGWAKTKDWKLQSLEVDETKFPGGLKTFIETIKKEYGIKYVGIWHSFMGYWWGIDSDSILYKKYEELIVKTNADIWMPDFRNSNKFFEFFNNWHKYLRDSGIDFLKIDTQGETGIFIQGNHSVPRAMYECHRAMEESAHINFNDQVLNCMGMGMESFCARPYTSLIRSSDDFYPQKEGSFAKHIVQNVYNSLFYDDFYYCDFDMWWTNQPGSIQSAVLRAMSGGPIYISDELGDTNADLLMKLIDADGAIHRCDSAAMPVSRQIYGYQDVLLITNSIQDVNVIGAFNLCNKVSEYEIYMADLKYKNSEKYIAHLYFSDRFILLDKEITMHLSLMPEECEIISFYPIKNNCIMFGDNNKFLSAGFNRKCINISELPLEVLVVEK